MSMPISLQNVLIGQVALVACCGVYLAWWGIAFRPGVTSGGLLGGILLLLLMLLAGAGITYDLMGIRALAEQAESSRLIPILIGGIVSYPVLLAVTVKLFHRIPTTELLLIVAWAVLEILVFSGLSSAGYLNGSSAVICYAAVGLATLIGLICYVIYYQLAPWPAFYCGMAPLGLEGLTMAALTFYTMH